MILIKQIFIFYSSNEASVLNGINRIDQLERLFCFTLASICYTESIMNKLVYLNEIFPLEESK